MKRIHTTMMISLMAVVVLVAGCKREYGTVTLGANIDNGRDAKVYIDNLTPCWHNNDLIRVNNQTCTTSAALGSSAQITDVVESNHYRAIYPADIVGNVDISSSNTIAVTLPREQQYEVDSRGDQKVKVPMGAYSSNESLTFHNLCSLIKVVISNRMNEDFVLDRIEVTADHAFLSGQGNATVTGSSENDKVEIPESTSAYNDVTLEFPSANRPTIGRGDRDTYVYYIIAPEFADEDDVTITLYFTNGQYATFEKHTSLPHNRMAQVNLTVEELEGWANGVLPGAFSVSGTQQVHFSQGNLQYRASTNTWRFAGHQYDYVGNATLGNVYVDGVKSNNANINSTYSGWIDLFGWGTSGWNSGANCYQPWSTSTTNSDYYPGGSYTNGLTGNYDEADWAWHNAISNGGNAVNQWRTLTRSEWAYLLIHRTDASAKCGTGNINGMGGLIILPDSWMLPSGCTFNSGFTTYVEGNYPDWTNNSYSLAQWAQMEDAGAVFLPAAGHRYRINVDHVGFGGYYWSSKPNGESNAYNIFFYSNSLDATNNYPRYNGFSVRPVQ